MSDSIPISTPLVTVDAASVFAAELEGRPKSTARVYAAAFRQFASHLGVKDAPAIIGTLAALSVPTAHAWLDAWRAALVQRGRRWRTINNRLAAVRALLRAAYRAGLLKQPLTVDDVPSQGWRPMTVPADRSQVRQVLDSVKSQSPMAARDRLILQLLLRGLEPSEIRYLNLDDVDITAGTLRITRPSRRKDPESISLTTALSELLIRWIELRGGAPGPLFISLDRVAQNADRRLSYTAIWKLVRRRSSAGGGEMLNPRRFRESGLAIAAEATNGDAYKVQAFARARSLSGAQLRVDRMRDVGGDVAAYISGDPAGAADSQKPRGRIGSAGKSRKPALPRATGPA